MSSTSTGREAENAVAEYLYSKNYRVLEQNWRTRICEIDIVAKKDNTIYFVEVKYRANDNQGGGLDYITAKKLKQMNFAAQIWVSEHEWTGDYCLSAAEVTGEDFTVTQFLKNCS